MQCGYYSIRELFLCKYFVKNLEDKVVIEVYVVAVKTLYSSFDNDIDSVTCFFVLYEIIIYLKWSIVMKWTFLSQGIQLSQYEMDLFRSRHPAQSATEKLLNWIVECPWHIIP